MQIICFHARLLLSLRPGPRRSLQSTRDIRDSHPVCAASPPPDPSAPRPVPISYKIAVLVFLENEAGKQLLLLRAKAPNLGAWSPIGGKLETGLGESPFECAVRETKEETGFEIATTDLHLFGMIAEKAYEAGSAEAEKSGLLPDGDGETVAEKVSNIASAAVDTAKDEAKKEGLA